MGRPLLIVILVALLMATGVAGASTSHETRLPIDPPTRMPEVSPGHAVVEKGDHLWKISERHLEIVAPRAPVSPYWLEVIDTNRPTLRSGNPDLIYPGETIELPAISELP